jgi:(S)-2-hydroxy-acid oxidase
MNNFLTSLRDYEQKALTILPKNASDYYRSGAGDESTLLRNCTDFKNFRIRPRVLRDVSKRDLTVEIFGSKVSAPFGIAPTAMQRMAHVDGEIASAKAAAKENVVYILSTLSTSSIEEVANCSGNSIKWFQLYIYKDRKLTESIIRRAENSNFKALVLTVDAPVFGLRRADLKNKFTLPNHLKLANFSDSVISEGGSGINEYVSKQFDPSITWDDVAWLIKLVLFVNSLFFKIKILFLLLDSQSFQLS